MRFVVRPAGIADAEAIAALHAASWRAAYRTIVPARRLDAALDRDRRRHWRATLARRRPRDVVLLAEAAGRVLGFVAVWHGAGGAFVDNLHIQPELRGKRIGERLLRDVARVQRSRGARRMFLWAFVANRSAIRFYCRLGGATRGRSFTKSHLCRAPCARLVWYRLDRLCR